MSSNLPAVVDKNSHDVSHIFSVYIAFLGDAEKTAAALNLEPFVVKNLAIAEDWPKKVKQWNELASGDPRDVQIQINRGINYVQATRLRSVLDKLIGELHSMSPTELIDALTVHTKYGSELKTRALTDLVKAAESCQLMTQRALGDTPEERPKTEGDSKGSQIMLSVAAAMAAAQDMGLDSEAAVKKSLELPPDDK